VENHDGKAVKSDLLRGDQVSGFHFREKRGIKVTANRYASRKREKIKKTY